ncbi:BQ00720 family protein [Pseudaminobacter sp. NGMCC 1.201702]|uniref:BQ00720 family protein n=1 Tax=Pseudaminobacter sp. NGMCC 1.201702 TaxID=3391825 RepID=UPI0039F0CBC6
MTYHDPRHPALTEAELAHLGEGTLAYLREIGSDELKGKFPGLPEIAPGTKLWALFAANGQPILLSDERDRALAGALENDLTPVAIH